MRPRAGVATAAAGVARTATQVRIGAEGERQEVVHKCRFASPRRPMDEERPAAPAPLGGVPRDGRCSPLGPGGILRATPRPNPEENSMPNRPARTADEITDSIRSLIDRVAEAKLTQEMARRGQDVAELLAERGEEVGSRANDAWRDPRPMRRDAAKRLARATADATTWSDRTWRRSLRPALKDLWSRRTLAVGAAGAAVPAGPG